MQRHEIEILNEAATFTLTEVCRSSGADSHFVYELVQEGVIRARGNRVNEWVFDGVSVVRIRKAYRLHQDLHVNLPGIALAFQLLDELNQH
jgi:chaperone modulatory protein CbpM